MSFGLRAWAGKQSSVGVDDERQFVFKILLCCARSTLVRLRFLVGAAFCGRSVGATRWVVWGLCT